MRVINYKPKNIIMNKIIKVSITITSLFIASSLLWYMLIFYITGEVDIWKWTIFTRTVHIGLTFLTFSQAMNQVDSL